MCCKAMFRRRVALGCVNDTNKVLPTLYRHVIMSETLANGVGAKANATNWRKIKKAQIEAVFHWFLMHFANALTMTVLPKALAKIRTIKNAPNVEVSQPNWNLP